MKKRYALILVVLAFFMGNSLAMASEVAQAEQNLEDLVNREVPIQEVEIPYIVEVEVPVAYTVHDTVYIYYEGEWTDSGCTMEEIEQLATLKWCESGNQDDVGQRLVVDTVVNRMRSKYFPDTLTEVMNQKYNGQYQYGVVKKINAGFRHFDDADIQMVCEEIVNPIDKDVIYYKTKSYHTGYAKPLYQHGAHYFSGLREGLEE